jgi:hypothetical protein
VLAARGRQALGHVWIDADVTAYVPLRDARVFRPAQARLRAQRLARARSAERTAHLFVRFTLADAPEPEHAIAAVAGASARTGARTPETRRRRSTAVAPLGCRRPRASPASEDHASIDGLDELKNSYYVSR